MLKRLNDWTLTVQDKKSVVVAYIDFSRSFDSVSHKTRSSADADNGLGAFSVQSRSTNIVPFHMLHIVSYYAIVTCL